MRLGMRSRFSFDTSSLLLYGMAALGIAFSVGISPAFADIGVSPSGASTYSVGIATPAGIAGLEPKIALNYSSQGGLGLLGQGWSIGGLSSITRCIKTKLQDGVDRPILDANGNGSTAAADSSLSTTDAFCLDGQRLVKNDSSPGIANGEYRLEQEAFSRITYSSSADQWKVETKAGTIMTYGGGATTKPAGAHSSSRSWLLSTVDDRKSNTITFSYQQPTSYDRRIDKITYGPSGQNAINFVYETRPDQSESWLNGIRNFNDKRLQMIRVLGVNSGNSGNQPSEIRRYLLTYTTSSITNHSLLSQIQMCVPAVGYETTFFTITSNAKVPGQQKCLAPTKFTYGTGTIATATTASGPDFSDGAGYSDSSFANTFQMADINGDGHPDICFFHKDKYLSCKTATLTASGTISWTGNWSSQTDFNKVDYFSRLQFVDVDRDGKLDACARFSNGIRCYSNTGTGFSSSYTSGAQFDDASGWGDAKYSNSITFVDINNDGFADVCGRGTAGIRCYLKSGSFSTSPSYAFSALSDSATVGTYTNNNTTVSIQTYSTIQYADINGDGYIDICAYLPKYTSGALSSNTYLYTCWVNNRDGTFHKVDTAIQIPATVVNIASAGSDGYSSLNINPIGLVDLNGDGKLDYCLRRTDGMRCWINNQQDNGDPAFSSASITGLSGLFGSTAWNDEKRASSIQFIDLNGDHRADLCSRDTGGVQCWINIDVLDATKGFQSTTTGFSSLLPDSNGFDSASLYKTIRYFMMANERPAIFARQRNGNSTVTYMGSLSSSDQQSLDLLESVQVGSTPAVNVTYRNGAINSDVYTKGNYSGSNAVSYATTTSPSLAAFDLPAPMPLVTQVSTIDPTTNQVSSTSYTYQGLVAQLRRGSLGFRSTFSSSSPSGNWAHTTYHQDWPYTGMTDAVVSGNTNKSSDIASGWLSKTQYLYAAIDLKSTLTNTVADTAPASACTLAPSALALKPSHLNSQLTNANYMLYPYRTIETTRSVNAYTTLTTVTSDTVLENSQGNVLCAATQTDAYDPIISASRTWKKVTANTYSTDPKWTSSNQWALGVLTQSQVGTYAPDSSLASVVVQSNQGGYNIAFNPNDLGGSLGPAYPDVAGVLTIINSLLY